MKHRLRAFARRARRFAAETKGGVALTFALTAPLMFAMLSLSIDYSRAQGLRSRLQSNLDAAVLAGASDTSGADREAVARNFFQATLFKDASAITVSTFAFDAAKGTLSGSARASSSILLMQAWGSSIDVVVRATSGVKTIQNRALDVVMCVDSTGSMGNTLSAVQTNALNFKTNLDTALAAQGIAPFERTRVRVVYYKDYGGNGYRNITATWYGWTYYPYGGPITGAALGDTPPLRASNFFPLPDETLSFSSFVSGEYANGGGDSPEAGLECLNEAMDSSFTRVGDTIAPGKVAQVVVPVIAIYTDAGAHPPSFKWSLENPVYPPANKMPRDYAGLLAKWNAPAIDQTNKMILFYGNPDLEDDNFFGQSSGWRTVETWPGFSLSGTLTSANLSFVTSLAKGIATRYKQPTLTN